MSDHDTKTEGVKWEKKKEAKTRNAARSDAAYRQIEQERATKARKKYPSTLNIDPLIVK